MEFAVALVTHTDRHVVAEVRESDAALRTVIAEYPPTRPAMVLRGGETKRYIINFRVRQSSFQSLPTKSLHTQSHDSTIDI